ncbi:hypothetical protein [Streptomyces sp. RB17]|uniref:hypothetical protein n=1 Tax=Streptomyces sp. RB17 TaxID=2585197 RepID=UPI0012955DB9|nr:hypothetical protein [Streptomyces sp. RB17]
MDSSITVHIVPRLDRGQPAIPVVVECFLEELQMHEVGRGDMEKEPTVTDDDLVLETVMMRGGLRNGESGRSTSRACWCDWCSVRKVSKWSV